MLLDAVKEEQTRAREAGKSARGSTHAGGIGRGAWGTYYTPFDPACSLHFLYCRSQWRATARSVFLASFFLCFLPAAEAYTFLPSRSWWCTRWATAWGPWTGARHVTVVLNVFVFARRGTFFITNIMVPSWRVGEQLAIVNRTKCRGDRLAVAIGE